MKKLRKLYYKIFPTYKVLELQFVPYSKADDMLLETRRNPDEQKWVLAKEEDENPIMGMVYLCRKIRITE